MKRGFCNIIYISKMVSKFTSCCLSPQAKQKEKGIFDIYFVLSRATPDSTNRNTASLFTPYCLGD